MAEVIDLEKLIYPTLKGLGYELVDIQRQNHDQMIRIFIDKVGGVNVDDCAAVSHHLTKFFAVEGIEFERLEVSSPGLDRSLKRAEDFSRFIGERVKVKLKVPVAGQRNFIGNLKSMEDGKIGLEIDGNIVTLDFDNLGQARLVPSVNWRRE